MLLTPEHDASAASMRKAKVKDADEEETSLLGCPALADKGLRMKVR